MDHPCHNCGHGVEDGKPFCAQCGAPQIRVTMPESLPALAAEPVSSGELPAFSLDSPAVPSSVTARTFSTRIEWPRALRACAVAALICAVVMALGLMVPLLAGLGAGFLCVSLYHRQNPAWRVTAGSGAQLGAVCGLLFFGMSAIFETLSVLLFHTDGQLREKMMEALQQAASRTADPQVQAVFDRLKTPEGMAAVLMLFLIVLFVVSIAAGSLAGALTGAFLGRRNRL
jgi:hypothetical protein